MRWNICGKTCAKNSSRISLCPHLMRLFLRCVMDSTSWKPTRNVSVLRDHSKMGEVGQRTETFRVGFQLVESITHLVNNLIKGGQSEIRELFFAQAFAYMFDGIKFGTVGRLSNEPDICRDPQVFGPMPTRLIHLHHHKVLGIGARYMRKSTGSSSPYRLTEG